MNKKYKGKSGVVLENGKLTLFRNIKTEKELKLNNWSAIVSEQWWLNPVGFDISSLHISSLEMNIRFYID